MPGHLRRFEELLGKSEAQAGPLVECKSESAGESIAIPQLYFPRYRKLIRVAGNIAKAVFQVMGIRNIGKDDSRVHGSEERYACGNCPET